MPANRRIRRKQFYMGASLLLGLLLIVVFIQYKPIANWIGRLVEDESNLLSDGIDKNQPIKLKVIYLEEGQFMSHYGRAFMLRYPNVSFEVLTAAPGENYLSILEPDVVVEMLRREQPDVLLMNPQAYERMANEGYLSALDGWIDRDRFDLESIDPQITASLRQLTGGTLYGLAPEVERMGLFFNLSLFETQGVPLPTPRMSWPDVLQLASRFRVEDSGAKQVYGLSLPAPSTPSELITLMGQTNGLRLIDPDSQRLNMHTAAWREIWGAALDGFMRDSVLWEKQPGRSLFLTGQVAMTIQPFRFVSDLVERGGNLSWEVTTEPVDPQDSDMSSSFNIPMIFAVNARSASERAAWELVKFVNSKEIAAFQARERPDIPLLSRRKQLVERLKSIGINANLEAFYELKPGSWHFEPGISVPFRRSLKERMDQEAAHVLEGRKSLSEALQFLEQSSAEELFRKAGETNMK